MPTASLTWKNKSTNLNPDSTKIERSENFPFGHVNADPPVELANGTSGGLNPGLANGSYEDTTVSLGKSYAYRVSTIKGSEVADSIPSSMMYVADDVNDIAYPGGSLPQSKQFNIDTEPFLHLDVGRQSFGYKDDGPHLTTSQINSYGLMTRMDNGYNGILRHNPFGFTIRNNTSTAYAYLWTEDLGNGKSADFMVQPGNLANTTTLLYASQDLDYPDGFTAFFVGSNNITASTGNNVGGHLPRNGIHYRSGVFGKSGSNNIWESNTAGTYSAPGATIGRTTTEDGVTQTFAGYPLKIVAARLSNTAEAFATGNIMYQVFDAGYEMAKSINLAGKSYHNNFESKTASNNLGGMYVSGSSMLSIAMPNYQQCMVSEVMYFGKALSLGEMNTVFAYLGNKFNTPVKVLGSEDLVN